MHVPRPARHRLRTHDLRSSHTQANAAPELLLGAHLAGGPQPVSRAVRGMRLGPAPCAVRRPTRGARGRAPRGTRRGLTRSPDTTQPSLRVVAVAARPARVPQADKLPGRPCTPRPSPGGAGPHPKMEPEMRVEAGCREGEMHELEDGGDGKRNRAVKGSGMRWTQGWAREHTADSPGETSLAHRGDGAPRPGLRAKKRG